MFFRHLDAFSMAGDLVLRRSAFVYRSGLPGGTGWGGVVVFALWIAVAARRWRRQHHRRLNALNAVIAVALVVQAFSISRIFGKVWYYLTLWAWGTTLLVVVSIGWTVARARRGAARRVARSSRARVAGRRARAGRDGRVDRRGVHARGARAAALRRSAGGRAGDGGRARARRRCAGGARRSLRRVLAGRRLQRVAGLRPRERARAARVRRRCAAGVAGAGHAASGDRRRRPGRRRAPPRHRVCSSTSGGSATATPR